SLAMAGVVGAVLAGCRETGGAAAVARSLAVRYGDRAFEVDVRAESGGQTAVVVTLRGGRTEDPAATARQIADLVRREFPLSGARDSIIVRLSAVEGRGAFRTRTVSTHRFGAGETP
ncbi:MAG TPA: hypothetical protein VJP59_11350, partial [Gemmatimonadota bacterium]|nr:hypothetical protein [Gemmatimonadota bacterium]